MRLRLSLLVLGGLLASGASVSAQTMVQKSSRPAANVNRPELAKTIRDRGILVQQIDVVTFFTRCPTPQEIANLQATFQVSFEINPTQNSNCAGLKEMQKRVYQTLLLMKSIQFNQKLPWTDLLLWNWFTSSVKKIHFTQPTGPTDLSRFVNGEIIVPVQPNSYLLLSDKFIDTAPSVRGGLMDLMVLLIHEARHAQKPHTCQWKDNTLAELGAWACQYHSFGLIADHSNLILTPEQKLILQQRPAGIYPSHFCLP